MMLPIGVHFMRMVDYDPSERLTVRLEIVVLFAFQASVCCDYDPHFMPH